MSWTHALTGSMLTANVDGSPKAAPTLWLPQERRLFIPKDSQDHARPVLVLDGHDASARFALLLHRDRIIGQKDGRQKVLVTL